MNCPKCNSKFIWGNDFDFEDYGIDDEKGIVSNYSCSKCDVTALIYIPFDDAIYGEDWKTSIPGYSSKESVNGVSTGVNVWYFYKKANKDKNKFFKMLSDFRKKHSDTKWIKMLNYALEDFNENPKKYKTIDDKQNILFKNLQNNKKVYER